MPRSSSKQKDTTGVIRQIRLLLLHCERMKLDIPSITLVERSERITKELRRMHFRQEPSGST